MLQMEWARDLEHTRDLVPFAEGHSHRERGSDKMAVDDIRLHIRDNVCEIFKEEIAIDVVI